jgi:phosphoglycolate phosphatase
MTVTPTTVLFDLDGTLTDPKEGITRSIQFALKELGHKVPDTASLLWCIGPPLKESFRRLLRSNDDVLLNKAVALYRQRFGVTGIFENTPYPEIIPALNTIRLAGFRLLLATSKPTVYARRILERFQLALFFDRVYGSEFDGTRTDKGDLIAHLIESEHLHVETALMVGDREHDILGAKKNGIHTAAVSYGYGTHEELQRARPDWIFHSPMELANFLTDQVKNDALTSSAL